MSLATATTQGPEALGNAAPAFAHLWDELEADPGPGVSFWAVGHVTRSRGTTEALADAGVSPLRPWPESAHHQDPSQAVDFLAYGPDGNPIGSSSAPAYVHLANLAAGFGLEQPLPDSDAGHIEVIGWRESVDTGRYRSPALSGAEWAGVLFLGLLMWWRP